MLLQQPGPSVIAAQAGIQSVYRARSARRPSPSFPRRPESSRFTEHGVHGDYLRHSRAGGDPVGLPSTECTATISVIPAQAGIQVGLPSTECTATISVIPAQAGIQSVYRARSARRLSSVIPAHAGIQSVYRARSARRLSPLFRPTRTCVVR